MAKKIGEILVDSGLLTPQLVAQGLEAQKFYGGRIGSLWLEMGVLDEKELVSALCEQKHCQPAKATQLKSVTKGTLTLIPLKVAVRYQVIPLARENRRLVVALTDPNDLLALDELAFITGCVIEPLLASERTVLNALEKYYGIERKRRETVEVVGAKAAAGAARAARQEAAAMPASPKLDEVTSEPSESTEDLTLDEAGAADADEARRFWSAQQTLMAKAAPASAPASQPASAPRSAPAQGPRPPDAPMLPAARLPTPPPPSLPPLPPLRETAARDEIVDGDDYLLDEGESTMVVGEAPRTIEEASRRLATVEVRDDIADVILWCTEELFARSALFIFQKSRTLGWTGQGEGLTPDRVRKVISPIEDVSLFTLARATQSHYLGPLPDNAGNKKLAELLGGPWPPAVLVIPFGVKGRPLGCFYAEDSPDELRAVDLHLMFRLLQKAGLALEMLLLRSKLVML